VAETPGLAAQDEILQVLFWLRGERLAQDASAVELVRFVSLPLAEVEQVLRRLAAVGLVTTETRSGTDGSLEARYRLSEDGVREGGRRFADEFADLTRPGHGECGDPECECRRTGNTDDCHNRAAN
jgi:DNA-binding transcriptional ArsR family regulator